MADLEVKMPSGCVARSGDPNAMIEKRKLSAEQKQPYVLAKIMIAALQAELKTVASGFHVNGVGNGSRNCDFQETCATMATIRRITEALESAHSIVSQFEPLGCDPNVSRVLYCEALDGLLAGLKRPEPKPVTQPILLRRVQSEECKEKLLEFGVNVNDPQVASGISGGLQSGENIDDYRACLAALYNTGCAQVVAGAIPPRKGPHMKASDLEAITPETFRLTLLITPEQIAYSRKCAAV